VNQFLQPADAIPDDRALASCESGSTAESGPIEFISFAIGDDQYGVDIMSVREIKEWTDITPLPRQPRHVRGVLNLRGVIVPIIDLRCCFGQGLTQVTPLHVIVIVHVGDREVGLIADRVLDIVPVDTEQIRPVPRTAQTESTDLLSGLVTIENTMIATIDLNNLIAHDVPEVQL
jgi:purine-binding chemotaxis protein CheW